MFFLVILCFDKALSQDWIQLNKIGTGNFSDQAYIVHSVTDVEGNTYVVGGYQGKLILGKTEHIGPNYSLGENNFVAKFDNQGNVVWSSVFNGAPGDIHFFVSEIHSDKDGKVYVTGRFENYVDFGGGLKFTKKKSGRFLCLFGNNGQFLWMQETNGYEIIVTSAGNIFQFTRSPQGDGITVLSYSNSNGTLEKTDNFENLWNSNNGSVIAVRAFDNVVYIIATTLNSTLVYLYVPSANQLQMIANIPQRIYKFFDFTNFEINYNALFLVGTFDTNIKKRTFGELTVEALSDAAYGRGGGFFVKYNFDSKRFEWAKVIKNMSDNFRNFLVSGNDALYLSTEACCGSRNNLSCYSTKGDSLWTRNFYTDGLNIGEYRGLGTDNNGNVYASGTVSNGSRATATFGSLSFKYDFSVGFLAKIGYPLPTRPKNLMAQPISSSAIKLSWIDSDNETNYTVEIRREDESNYSVLISLKSNSSEFIATNLDCKKSYSFRVMAIGKGGSSEYSNAVSLSPLNLPTPRIAFSKPNACKGESVWLEAPSGFTSYFWNTGSSSQKIQTSFTGEFIVKVKDNSGCESNFSEKVKITFYDYPDTLITAKNDEIVYSGIAESFNWFLNEKVVPGETRTNIKPIESGIYRVEATANGCTSSSNKVNFVVTGIEPSHSSVNIYPNPTTGNTNISFGAGSNVSVRLKLFDLSGKLVFQDEKSESQDTIIIECIDLISGLYLLELEFDGSIIYKKILVK